MSNNEADSLISLVIACMLNPTVHDNCCKNKANTASLVPR